MRCPGSVRLEATLPNEDSAYAREGTVAHELVEEYLRGELTMDELYDAEMVKCAREFVQYVDQI